MKNSTIMRSSILSALLLIGFSLSINLMAGEIKLKEGNNDLKITQNDYYQLGLSHHMAQLESFEVKTKQGFFVQLGATGYGYNMEVGNPALPVLKKVIEVPVDAYVSVQVFSKEVTEYELDNWKINNPIMPVQPPVSKSDDPENLEFKINQSTYQKDEYFGRDLVTVTELGIMRGVRMARIEISPVTYNPVQNKIQVCTSAEIEITFAGANVSRTKQMKRESFSPHFEGIYSMLFNYKPVESKELIMDSPVTYVIVSDPMFQSDLQPFVQWKTKKGFKVVEAYTDDPNVGNSTSSISSYLEDLYNNPPAGYNPQSFVLFVGDVAQVPTFSGSAGNHVTDLYYCEYTGDIYPECYYGRFSATSTAELQPQIDKTLEYEQYLMPDPTFLDEVVMVAGADYSHATTWGNGQINYGTDYYFNIAHGITSHTYLQPEPSGGNYSQQIKTNVSDGVSYANYTAHCSPSGWADPSFVISDVSSLNNAHKYPLMVGNCCSSVEFQTDCFGEAVLRAADKGALGYIGGSNSTYWDEDFWWGVGFEAISANPTYDPNNLGAYDRTFHDNGEPIAEWYVTQGQMPSAGNLAVTQAGSSLEDYYWEIYHLMGDPSLMVYFSQPPAISVSYDPLMPLGSTSFTVTTEAYAYVAISKDGVLHGAAIADATGMANVTLDPISVPGDADIVVTKQNGMPFMGTVTVASPTGPYVLLDDYVLDDASGNNNGLADYGESINFDVTLENVGNSTASNVVGTLSTSSTNVTINNNSQNWPDIPSGATSTEIGAFGVNIGGGVPDQDVVMFTLDVTDGNETWSSDFSITLQAPVIDAGNIVIDDNTGGNGNGRLDPGETVDIIIETMNNGHSSLANIEAEIALPSPYATMNDSTDNLGTLNVGETKNATFNITVDNSTPIGTNIDIHFIAVGGLYGVQEQFVETVGIVDEDFETGDFTQYPWQNTGTAPWTIDSSDPYEGTYCAKSGVITHNQESVLSVSFDVVSADNISFWRKVSSESSYDYLRFFIDGNEMGSWSGDEGWSQETYPVDAGMHTFTWKYTKDGSVSSGADCGWVDYIIFPPVNNDPILHAGNLTIDDAAGNGNGAIEPGETVDLVISNSNSGLSAAMNVVAELTTASPYLTIQNSTYNVGTIQANGSENAVFTVTAAYGAPLGTVIDLSYDVYCSATSDQQDYAVYVGDLIQIEDYETGDFSAFSWTFAGSADWVIDGSDPYEGDYCAKSGFITHDQTSEMIITLDILTDDVITFYRKVSSESNYDYLRFYIDGVQQDEWSGTVGWSQVSYDVTAGSHEFKWAYEKDYSVSSGSDCAWVDYIEFPPVYSVPPSIMVDLTLNLEGPFNGTDMNTILSGMAEFPLSQPYNIDPWYYDGAENVPAVPGTDVVDWVLIELRETPGDASTATGSTMIARQAGFLMKDGSVVSMDGVMDLQFFVVPTENLYVVVWHKNHLGIMSNYPLTETGGVYSYDYTTGQDQVFGDYLAHKELTPGVWGMIAGDGTCDGQIDNIDKNIVWSNEVGLSGYYNGDFNLDGQIDNADKNNCWYPNGGSGSQVVDKTAQVGYSSQVPK